MSNAIPARAVPTEADVLGYLDELSNWKRWGEHDQLGTLNLITDEVRAQAAAIVRCGRAVSCAHDIAATPASAGEASGRSNVQRFMLRTAQDPTDGRAATTGEYFGIAHHGSTITHIDSLSHEFWDGYGYNGLPAAKVNIAHGAESLSIQSASNGISTRGVLLDVATLLGVDALEPSTVVTPDNLEQAERRQGVQVRSGDAVVLRTGVVPGREHDSGSGWGADCLPWLHSRGAAVVACDTINDPLPPLYDEVIVPFHIVGIVAMGLWLVDNCSLESLSITCRELNQYEFFFTIAPLRLEGGTGSPVNPIAVF